MKKKLLFAFCLFAFFITNAQEFSKTRLIVKYKTTTNAKSKQNAQKILSKYNFKEAKSLSFYKKNQKKTTNSDILLLSFSKEIQILNAVKELQQTNLFEFVEPDYKGFGAGERASVLAITPNDALYNRQWSLLNDGTFTAPGANPATIDADVDMDLAWDITTGNDAITIAVLDSGLRMNHPEFTSRIWVNADELSDGLDTDTNGFVDDINGWDFVNDDNDPTDDHGHGTNVTGIIAATGDNNIGYSGVDWQCKIMPIKILDENNAGFYSNWIAGINYAVSKGAKIINMSVGGSTYSAAMETAVDNAHANGIIITVSNMNFNNDTPYYPAAYTKTIAVGSTDSDDTRSNPFFWNVTSGSNYGSHIDVVAPGNFIFGLSHSSDTNYNGYWGGTSQAAPLVAGICSLILDQKPSLTPDEVKAVLRDTAEDMVGDPVEDTAGFDNFYGAGRVNAYNALQNVLSTEKIEQKKYHFYPNPTTSVLKTSSELNNSNYLVYNILGKKTLEGIITNNSIDLSSLNPGIYMLKIKNNNSFITQKVIKK